MTTTTPPATVKRTGHMGHPPCGRACILNPAHRHEFRCCKDETCVLCHSEDRVRWRVPWKGMR
jgi:hypothetical protein